MATQRIRTRGTVKWFDPRKGFGFAERAGSPPVFIHIGAVATDGLSSLNRGDAIEFVVDITRRGPVAHEIRLAT